MLKRWLGGICVALVALMLLPSIVLAGTYNYYSPITIFNNSTSTYSVLPILVTANNTQLANLGYINATGLDTDINEAGVSRTSTLASSKVGVVLGSVAAHQTRNLVYSMGYAPARTGFPIIVGHGGNFTAGLNAGTGEWSIEIKGYFDTTVTGNIAGDQNPTISISAPGTLLVSMPSYPAGASWTVAGVSSGLHNITISSTNNHTYGYLDGVQKNDYAAYTSVTMFTGVKMGGSPNIYWEHFKETIAGVLKVDIRPTSIIQGTNLVDQSGNGNNGTISWGTNPAGIEVTLGGVLTTSTYSSPGGSSATPPAALPVPTGINIFETPGAVQATWFMYPSILKMSTSLGWDVAVTYSLIELGIAMMLAFAVLMAVPNWWYWLGTFSITFGTFTASGECASWINLIIIGFTIFVAYLFSRT